MTQCFTISLSSLDLGECFGASWSSSGIRQGTLHRSTVTFSADGFNGDATRVVTLEAWSDGFGAGDSTTDQDDQCYSAPAPVISGPTTFPASRSVELTGDSSLCRFRYHQWQRRNAAGAMVVHQFDTGDIVHVHGNSVGRGIPRRRDRRGDATNVELRLWCRQQQHGDQVAYRYAGPRARRSPVPARSKPDNRWTSQATHLPRSSVTTNGAGTIDPARRSFTGVDKRPQPLRPQKRCPPRASTAARRST